MMATPASPKRKTLIELLHENYDTRNKLDPIKCTCKTGLMREGRPVFCGWDGERPFCPLKPSPSS